MIMYETRNIIITSYAFLNVRCPAEKYMRPEIQGRNITYYVHVLRRVYKHSIGVEQIVKGTTLFSILLLRF